MSRLDSKILFSAIMTVILGFGFAGAAGIDPAVKEECKKQAISIIANGLSDTDPQFRGKAVEVVSNARLNELMPRVEKLMGDDYVPVRFTAAIAVGDMKYDNSMAALRKLVEVGDDTSKIAAAYALAKLGDKRNVPIIHEALTSTDQNLKANAALLLGKLGNKDDIAVLYKVLGDVTASDAALFQAAESIAALGDAGIYSRLWTMLISKHPDDRIIGVRAMRALGTAQAKEAILTMFYDEVLEVRLVAAAELGKLGDSSGYTEVVDAITKPLSQIDQEAMERAYSYRKKDDKDGAKQDKESRMLFQPVYRTTEEYEQAVERAKILAALAIGYIKDNTLDAYLPKLLTDPSRDVRIAAAQSVMLRFN